MARHSTHYQNIVSNTLSQRAFRRETELENWIQKYDREMGEKQDELEQLQTEFTEETADLKELEEKLEVGNLICRIAGKLWRAFNLVNQSPERIGKFSIWQRTKALASVVCACM